MDTEIVYFPEKDDNVAGTWIMDYRFGGLY